MSDEQKARLWDMVRTLASGGDHLTLGIPDEGLVLVDHSGEMYEGGTLEDAVRAACEARGRRSN